MDRAAWILKEEMPSWCFGLGGRSASFGDSFGDMYDHHTVVMNTPAARGSTPSAAHRTIATATEATSSWARRANATGRRPNQRRDELAIQGSHNDAYVDEQAGADRIGTQRQADQQGSTWPAARCRRCWANWPANGKPLKWDDVANSEFQFGPAPDVANFDTPPPSKPDTTDNYPMPRPGIYDNPLKAPRVPADKTYRRLA